MQLQSLRFNNNFDFHIVVDPEIIPEVTRVPPMLAQPFLENAIEHGISKVERRGKIVLRYKQLPQSIRFEITDNGIGLTGSVTDSKQNGIHHESLSISICRERLELLHKRNGTRINFSISELLNGTEVEGTKVVFDIPVHLNN
jgi:LytS/YehU family sensor histidine kinase